MNDDREKHGTGSMALVMLALPIVYLLLLGPAARLHASLPPAAQSGIETIYAPLEWLDRQLPGQPFSWYIELWQ